MKKLLSGLLTFSVALFYVSCEEDKASKPEVTYDSFSIQTAMTLDAGADANAEIVRMIPGSETQAVLFHLL